MVDEQVTMKCPGLGSGWSDSSCWPWDWWSDPDHYKGRVPRMVCVFFVLLQRVLIFLVEVNSGQSFHCVWSQSTSSFITVPSSTIITIAHRLNTVLDYDRILVLKEGAIAELDTPRFLSASYWLFIIFCIFRNLLKVEGGLFKGMCQDAGVGLSWS